MSRILVIGLSGQVGEALLPRLRERELSVLALSRQAREPHAGVDWILGSLESMPALPAGIDTVLSLGPLDAFAAWFATAGPRSARVIALGSTGRTDKLDSLDAAERELAGRLRAAEEQLFAAAAHQDCAVTLLRPTLIYGNGRDLTLSRLLGFARRWGFLPLPSDARGLRQPVHVADVAGAIVACLDAAGTEGRAYDLPGGETLRFDVMVRRAMTRLAPGRPVLLLPAGWFQTALQLGAWWRRAPVNQGVLARLRRDQLADDSAARHDFGYRPRRFDP